METKQMNYIIKITPKYGGREKVYPVIFETREDATQQIEKIRSQFNTYEVREMRGID